MKTKHFKPTSFDGDVQIMDIADIEAAQIRFNPKSRDIDIIYSVYDQDELENMSYIVIKNMVEAAGGEYKTKGQGIEFLMNM